MAVEETDHGTFTCTIHDYHATATPDPVGTGQLLTPAGGAYTSDCADCQEAARRAQQHAADQRLHEG